MKKLTLLFAILLITTLNVVGQRTVKTYQQAYVLNTETAKRIATEVQLSHKSSTIQIFLIDYPVLDEISDFDPKKRYSLINDDLIVDYIEDDKFITFNLINKKVYKVKKKKRTDQIIN